ncbi:MAG: twin-arginine translocation signal domain-containing protein, partial [Gemmatimonadetes bacterium]|nr:twin-arginine translocation signal domain-containing protein [Gemmatimonadota bacterium]
MTTPGDTTRRDFLSCLAGAGVALAAPRALFGSTPPVQE